MASTNNNIFKTKLISESDIIKVTNIRGPAAKGVAGIIMLALGYNKINKLYNKHRQKSSLDFINSILEDLKINYEILNTELYRIPMTGPFITVSNHPYGGLESLILFKELNKIRPDIKVIGNFLFHKIEPVKDFIFPVNPFETHKNDKSSITGLKEALQHLNENKSLIIFPAGEVSTYYPDNIGITDRKWIKSAVKFIKKAQVPVIPVYFHGSNSFMFHALGLINPLLRTAKIPSEFLNKKRKLIKVRIGNPIPLKEQNEFPDVERFGRFLRAKVYLLGTNIDVPKFFKPAFSFPEKAEEIIKPADKVLLKQEIDKLPSESFLFKHTNYNIYCVQAALIPNLLNEIGRLRELTFRDIGEGTNRKSDVDEFDLYYKHLIIWDEDSCNIVGSYRIGMGKQIMEQYGPKGFYIRSLFKIKKPFHTILNESLELGRSFIVREYQKNPITLFLLWKGILYFLLRNPKYRFLIGPVSISNRFSNLSKSLIVNYIEQNYFNAHLAKFIKPRKKFNFQLKNTDTNGLTDNIKDLKGLDTILKDIEPDNFRIPVLLKKYLELNGKIVCFNIDPKFNDTLDGLLVLDLHNVPADTVKLLSKELNEKYLLNLINFSSSEVLNGYRHEAIAQL